MEMHKRKAVESSQTAADLKLHLDKYQAQLKEAQVSVAEKTGALEQESFKYKRMQVNLLYKLCNIWYWCTFTYLTPTLSIIDLDIPKKLKLLLRYVTVIDIYWSMYLGK